MGRAGLLRQRSASAYQQAMAARERTGESHDGGNEPYQRPKGLDRPAVSAKVQVRDPEQSPIGKANSGTRRTKEIKQGISHLRKRKVNSRESPHGEEEETPESENVVQVPTYTRKTRSPVDAQASPPISNPRPPEDGSRETEYGEGNGALHAVRPDARSRRRADSREGSRATRRYGHGANRNPGE